MKKLMSLLILLSVLVLPVLAGCPDTVLPVLPVSAAKPSETPCSAFSKT